MFKPRSAGQFADAPTTQTRRSEVPTPPGPHGGVVFLGAGSASGYIPVKNMMCAFGVPGYMIHGTPGAGFSVIPVDFSVAPGM